MTHIRCFVMIAAILAFSAATRAEASRGCAVAGDPPLVVTQVQEAGSGDWYRTANELAATQMKNGTAVVVQSEIDGARVDVIVWMHRPVVDSPPPSSAGWHIERFFSMTDAATRYDALAQSNASTRLVSSPWGGTSCRPTIIDRFSDVAWVVYYDPVTRRRASRH